MNDIPQRLAAVLAADIAGYTRLMERDEAGIVANWRRARAEVIDPTVTRHHGRVVKLTGDGFLAEFATAESAVKAALEMQGAFAALFGADPAERRVAFRIGINLGDIWVDAEDIYGAGVNVAARLEALAEPGGICIADAVRNAVKHRVEARYHDLGLRTVKNVAEPIRVWRVRAIEERATLPSSIAAPVKSAAASRSLGGYVTTAILAGVIATAGYWLLTRNPDAQWLAEEALPQIERFVAVPDFESAYALAKQAEARVPGSPEIEQLWPRMAWRATIPSEPPGATVYRRSYTGTEQDWEVLGRTPLTDVHIPFGLSRLRFELSGHTPLQRTLGGGQVLLGNTLGPETLFFANVGVTDIRLDTPESLPADKARVPGWTEEIDGRPVAFAEYLLDRHEVTNRQFKSFVDARGYERREFWEHPFQDGARTLEFDEAIARFVDQTGRPGPSTWQAGDYPDGQDDFPVGGISWYEAAAYARFAGAELPSVYHWRRAVAFGTMFWTIQPSNFGQRGPRGVGESDAMDWTGTFDMLGNVREWCFNAAGEQRFILGGGWNDPAYVAAAFDSVQPPFDRSAANGMRLALVADDAAAVARAPLPPQQAQIAIDFEEYPPISDDTFAAYRQMYAYDRVPLEPKIEAVESARNWKRERITFTAAYGGERMSMYLYLPASGAPPYQTVVHWPGAQVMFMDSVDAGALPIDFLARNGRAVAVPVFKNTLERGGGRGRAAVPPVDTAAFRDLTFQWVNDFRRSIDYLETRNDIDRRGFAFLGWSWGGAMAPMAIALEPRVKTAVLIVAGVRQRDPLSLVAISTFPEASPVTFLPRATVPTLMINGEYDVIFPLQSAAQPFFDHLGTPASDKKQVITPDGHFIPEALMMRDTLDWLDRYLGPVR